MTYVVIVVLVGLVAFFLATFLLGLAWRNDRRELQAHHQAREGFLQKILESERELHAEDVKRLDGLAREERRELYSRIQAYDPNVGELRPAPSLVEPSRPGESTVSPRSYTEEDLGQMGLVQQADGLIRDTRSSALYETVEDWRFWMADLKKRNLPENVHPEAVRENGWEEAVQLARAQATKKNGPAKN
jgi:hypothetical protein